MQFITSTGYDVAAIMRDAHRRARKAMPTWGVHHKYNQVFQTYLEQVWCLAQHEHRARLCTGATVTVAKAFDNGNSPLWRM
jgi:uncharacterized protein with PIN domain